MPTHRSLPTRLLFSPPLKLPNASKNRPRPRLFTQNCPLLLISTPPSRPELPFLHNSSNAQQPHRPFRTQSPFQISRLLTTERKRFWKETVVRVIKYSFYGYSSYALFWLAYTGFKSEQLERKFPSPPEWSLFTRMFYRKARGDQQPSADPNGLVHYEEVGRTFFTTLVRLEDPSIDGAGLQPGLKDEGNIFIPEDGVTIVAKGGLDISSKSEPWRRGYYICLMGSAQAGEHLDGWVRDITRGISFPGNMVLGPSNPRPKPVPYAARAAPLEENCVPAFQSPELYYSKILNTQGFTTRQRLDAILGWADWLDYKGLPARAKEKYAWGLDIAVAALPAEAHNIIDIKTGIISDKATFVSSNLFLATTALAVHHARHKNIANALPILLSVLRAKRQLPIPPKNTAPQITEITSRKENTLLTALKNFLYTPPYPAAPPTGDEPQFRNPMALCEEAGIMAHIGEILFASASRPLATSATAENKALQSQHVGINWTRDAVDTAESTLEITPRHDSEARKQCAECVEVAIENWEKMVAKMLRLAQSRRQTPDQGKSSSVLTSHTTGSKWSLGLWRGKNSTTVEADDGPERWEREAKALEQRKAKLDQMLRAEGLVTDQEIFPGTEWGLLFR